MAHLSKDAVAVVGDDDTAHGVQEHLQHRPTRQSISMSTRRYDQAEDEYSLPAEKHSREENGLLSPSLNKKLKVRHQRNNEQLVLQAEYF